MVCSHLLQATPKIRGKVTLVGEVETDETWEKEEEEEGEELAEDGGQAKQDKPSLSHCACVRRRKLLAPENGLDEGLASQLPTRALLGWDEEQRERCVVGPRGSGSAELPGVRIPGLGWK